MNQTRQDHTSQPSPPPKPGGWLKSNIVQRVLTALVLLPPLLLIVQEGQLWLAALVVFANFIGLDEIYRIMEARGLRPRRAAGMIVGTVMVSLAYFSNEYFITLSLTFGTLIVFVFQLRDRNIDRAIMSIGATLFGLIYVSWLLGHILLARNIEFEILRKYGAETLRQFTELGWSHDQPFYNLGVFLVITILIGTFLTDTGAFFGGKAFGRTKLAPSISPGKTREGAFFGVIGGMLGTGLMKIAFGSPIPWNHTLMLGLLIALAGIVGDLCESLLKRDARVKDSGSLIPGHGGLLDRLDSILFTMPVGYYYAKIYLYAQTHQVLELNEALLPF